MIDLDGFDDGPSPAGSAADAAAEHAADKPARRMLQPTKDALREQIKRKDALIAAQGEAIEALQARERGVAGIVFCVGGVVGSLLTAFGGAL